MSLIERAVARLSGDGGVRIAYPPRPVPPADRAGPSQRGNGNPAIEPAAEPSVVTGRGPRVAADVTLGEPVALSLDRMAEAGLLIPSARATATGQEFRQIKSAVLETAIGVRASQAPQGRRVAIVSALPGEGKTYCAINLAVSIASSGEQPVLLVDGDLVRPSVGRYLGVDGAPGLLDAMNAERPVFQMIRPTDVAGLHVLPGGTDAGRAGAPPSQAGEFLASRRMVAVLDEISAAFPDWLVVIDTPPLLAVTETRSLVQQVGQVLLVVAAGGTTRRSIQAALAALPEGARASLVLNKAAAQRNRHDTWYGYGY